MRTRFRAPFRRPVFLLGLAAFLTALVVQSGELGSSDTAHRLQATHSFWTSQPAVLPEDYPDFGLIGRGGRIYGWYGLGQSLLMLPSDIVGTYLEKLPIFADYEGNDPSVRDMVVSVTTNTLVCVLAILMCFRFLRRLEFTVAQAMTGALGLLFATTFLHYTQNMLENNLIMLLTLTGFCFQYEWLRTGRTRALLYGSLALGANLLVRLTTALDLVAVGSFLLLVLLMEKAGWPNIKARLSAYLKIVTPCYALFFAIDRAYQYYRFGSVFNTYLSVFAEQQKQLDPSLPANFPWSTPWRVGLLGPLITPEKSIFLFDPLIVLSLLLAPLLWKRLRPEMRAWLAVTALLVATYIIFYARYMVWSGDFAWGDRYVSTAVEVLAMMAIPLLLRHRQQLRPLCFRTGLVLVAVSVAFQLASVAFWHPLEIYQMNTLGHPTFVIGLRFENIAAVALGKVQAWGLSNSWTWDDPWQRLRSTTPYFLPFLLGKNADVPRWLAHTLAVAWFGLLAGLLAVLAVIRRRMARQGFDGPAVV
ncbi:MAG TPA: hypothetical protein VES66_09910 [Terriglobales bacterium]|nr:hypothetical protein [Terriglobales bacterium]